MLNMNVEIERFNEKRRIPEGVKHVAKSLGGAALSGLAGYAAAKGIETFITDIRPEEVFEGVVVVGSAVLGGFVTAEATA